MRSITRHLPTLTIVALFFFSYIPFLYVPGFDEHKLPLYVTLVGSTISLAVFGLLSRPKDADALKWVLFYIPFAVYSLGTYTIVGDALNDSFTLRTIVLVNPVFAFLALCCLGKKDRVIGATTWFLSACLPVLVYMLATGRGMPTERHYESLFEGTKIDVDQALSIQLGLLAACATYYLDGKAKWPKRLAIVAIVLSLLGLLTLGERGPLIATICVFVLFGLHKLKTGRVSAGLMIGTAAIACVAGAFAMGSGVPGTKLETIQKLELAAKEGNPRIYLFQEAISLFVSDARTEVFGAGMDSFKTYIGSNSRGGYPHNIILELLCEYGVVGASLFIVPFVCALYMRKRRLGTILGRSAEERTVFLLAIYFWSECMFSGALRDSWFLVFYTFLLFPPVKYWRLRPAGQSIAKASQMAAFEGHLPVSSRFNQSSSS